MTETTVPDTDLAHARDGDDAAFGRLVAPLRRELHAHCYRMLGSSHDADDALQDTLVRAWRKLAGFEGRSSFRTWLYTVATRVCLDLVDARDRRALPMDLAAASDRVVREDVPLTEVAWLGPYPDEPGARAEEREAVELAFVAALQHLPGNQRAALVLFEVLGFSAAEIATVMDTSTASVNSALQRARKLVSEKVPDIGQQRTLRELDDARLRAVVTGYSTALEQGDAEALVALLTEDVTWSMPPMGRWYAGIADVEAFARAVPVSGDCGSWRHLEVVANGQVAVASYLRPPGEPDDAPHRPWSIDVLTLRGDRIAAVTSFIGAEHHAAFGLPAELP